MLKQNKTKQNYLPALCRSATQNTNNLLRLGPYLYQVSLCVGKSAKMQTLLVSSTLERQSSPHTKASLEIAALEEESGEEKRGLHDLLPLSSVFPPCSIPIFSLHVLFLIFDLCLHCHHSKPVSSWMCSFP